MDWRRRSVEGEMPCEEDGTLLFVSVVVVERTVK
jgi:hypothetical protein